MSIFDTLAARLFSGQINQAVRQQLAVIENDNTFFVGTRTMGESNRDRLISDRAEILDQSLEAWRTNPIARRCIELTSQYVVGGGLSITSPDAAADAFIGEFWNHRLNHLPVRVFEMCDELSRTGNLFLLLSTDAAGMSYVRVIPAADIDSIQGRDNDLEQPLSFTLKADGVTFEQTTYPAYDPSKDKNDQPVMLQYAVNRPAGGQWGESDLAPLLKWLSRYSGWLEDRARLNRYRNAFLFIVQAKFANEAARKARQTALNAQPPTPGSILVADDTEEWKTINARLESGDVKEDGLALKKMIAAGAGIPLHFLAEPESATRTTAEAAGGPTYRRMEQRQQYFLWLITDLLKVALARRAAVVRKLDKNAQLVVAGGDISYRDNISLAMASSNMINVLCELRDRQLIDNAEFIRLLYRFAGESVDAEDLLKRGKAAGITGQGTRPVIFDDGVSKGKRKQAIPPAVKDADESISMPKPSGEI